MRRCKQIDEKTALCVQKIADGGSTAQALSESGLFSARDGRLLALPARTGSMAETLEQVADTLRYFRYIPYMFMGSLCYVMGNVLSAFRRGDLQKRMRASAISGRRQNLEGLLASATVGAGLWIVTDRKSVV